MNLHKRAVAVKVIQIMLSSKHLRAHNYVINNVVHGTPAIINSWMVMIGAAWHSHET